MTFFYKKEYGIVVPVAGKNPPKPGRLALMVSSSLDMKLYTEPHAAGNASDEPLPSFRPLMMSRIHYDGSEKFGFSITGPVISSPYAVMILESLINWGAESVLFVGWAGAVSPHVKVGDIIVADTAFIDEGTSKSYGGDALVPETPDKIMTDALFSALEARMSRVHRGAIWTTDAIFMETDEKIRYYQFQNVLGVEMEISALFAACRFRGIPAAAVTVVSDEVSDLTWKTGFKDEAFVTNRKKLCEAILQICKDPSFPSLKTASE